MTGRLLETLWGALLGSGVSLLSVWHWYAAQERAKRRMYGASYSGYRSWQHDIWGPQDPKRWRRLFLRELFFVGGAR